MPIFTLQDVVQRNRFADAENVVESIGDIAPELTTLPNKTISGSIVTVPIRTSVPLLDFPEANRGTAGRKASYSMSDVKAMFIGDIIQIDKKVANTADEGAAAFIAEEKSAHVLGGLQTMGYQNIYGTRFRKSGYAGLYQQLGDYQTISANPNYQGDKLKELAVMKSAQADDAGTSAILLCIGKQYAYQFWAHGRTFAFGKLREETLSDEDNLKYGGYAVDVDAQVGLVLANPFACARIKNITSANPLTDNLIADAELLLPNGAPYIIIASRKAVATLEASRKAAGTHFVTIGSKGEQIIGRAENFRGSRIIRTISVLDDETDASLKALAATTDVKRKPLDGTIK